LTGADGVALVGAEKGLEVEKGSLRHGNGLFLI